MRTDENPDDAVRLAILIPIYGHTALVFEAIYSASTQDLGAALHIVCVVDGDPDTTLMRLLTSFAATPANRCSPYWRRNGGLSAARNSAVEIALQRFRNLEAIFFLDADNRLGPNALTQALNRLKLGEADVLYPELVNFGLRSSQDTAGGFSAPALLRGNYIEAGSLVAASVFRQGLRFDETLLNGFEDWAFWLSLLSAGFRFAHEPSLRLQYRRRPESMLANTARKSARVRGDIEAKNQDLFSPAGRLQFEARDEPRYALVHTDRGFVEFSMDLGVEGEYHDLAACGCRLNLYRCAAMWTHFPPLVCFGASETIVNLREKGLLPGLIWRLTTSRFEGVKCRLLHGTSIGLSTCHAHEGETQLMLLPRKRLCEAIKMQKSILEEPMLTMEMTGARSASNQPDNIEVATEKIVAAWSAQDIAFSASVAWTWRSPVTPRLPPDIEEDIFPSPLPDDRRHVGFLLNGANVPSLDAAAFRDAGWTPHLFVFGDKVPAESLAIFRTTSFIDAPALQAGFPPAPDQLFLGARLTRGVDTHSLRSIVASKWLAAVVVFGACEALSELGGLKAAGVAVVVTWNKTECQRAAALGRDDDMAYLLAAYEHAIDAFMVSSQTDTTHLVALGVPRSKIHCEGHGLDLQSLVCKLSATLKR